MGVTCLAVTSIIFSGCDKDNKNDVVNENIIEFTGEYPTPEYVRYSEDGNVFEILAIPGQIVLSVEGLNSDNVSQIVEKQGGRIIEQVPANGHYLIEISKVSENDFLESVKNVGGLNAYLNIVEFPKEKYDYFVFDDYDDVNNVQHGKKVSTTLSSCQSNASIKEINIYNLNF